MMHATPPAPAPDWSRRVQFRIPVHGINLVYSIDGFADHWLLPDGPVPEAPWHDRCLEHFKALLTAWVGRSARNAAVFRDIAIGVQREKPRVGYNPDLCVVEPPPPPADMDSIKLWQPGHAPPVFAFEAVSRNHPYKDYLTVPDMCGVLGVFELVVFDPLLAGPRYTGGPHRLQIWRPRPEDGDFTRAYAGPGPAYSEYLGAYLLPDRKNRRLSIASTPTGEGLWLTREEEARAKSEEARAREEAARARAEEAQRAEEAARARAEEARRAEEAARASERAARARIAELEAELARLRGERSG